VESIRGLVLACVVRSSENAITKLTTRLFRFRLRDNKRRILTSCYNHPTGEPGQGIRSMCSVG
jgi:hypothetical protein